MDKDIRNVFVMGDMDQLHSQFQQLMHYCAMDVLTTFRLFQTLWPRYRLKCPSPVSFAGMLEMVRE